MRQSIVTLAVLALLLGASAPAAAVGGGPTASVSESASSLHSGQACSFPLSVTDATGTEVVLEQKPERVTTLGPSAAQTMWEIGGKAQVVGLSKHALYLDGAESRTNVSKAGFGYSTETVVSTNADLVLAANITPSATVQQLRDAGMTVYVFEKATSIDDVQRKTTRIGRLTGNCQGAAEVNRWMTENVAAARNATESESDVRTLYPMAGGYVAGDDTFISTVIEAAGGENVAAADYTGYVKLSDEVVLELDPSFLVLTEASTYLTGKEPWASTTAVEGNNTVVVSSDYMSQPAPRSVVYAVRNVTEALHPEAAANAEWTARGEVHVSTTASPTASPSGTASDTATAADEGTVTPTPAGTESSGPGFGFAAAVGALLAVALLTRRD